MKKLFGVITILAMMASCKSKTGSAVEIARRDSLVRVAIADSIAKAEAAKKEAARKAEAARQAEYGSYNSGSSNTAKAPQKPKGLSKAAKGAIIGGVVGAGTGAVINKKNRAAGAVIGGAAGAGVGYTIGRAGDRKSGRVEEGKAYRKHKRESNQ